MSYDFDIEADYKVRDTNVTQQNGAGDCTANLVEKVIAEKKRILPDAALCIEYKDHSVPPKGVRHWYRNIGKNRVCQK